MFNPQERSQPLTFSPFLFLACLLLGGMASATPSITLSKRTAPPTSRILVTGRGFKPNVGVDIYFDSQEEARAMADGSGAFSQIAIQAPASALPGTHWVSAVERSGHTGAQATFLVWTAWRQFHRQNMQRRNPYENVLNVNNVGSLQLKWRGTINGISAPAVVNGVVYVGSRDNSIYALKASTGAKLWSYQTGGPVDSSPAVANGVVYVGSYDNSVYALKASTGALLWSYATGSLVESSPAVANGVVYVGSDDSNV
jgi:outer membrane protein assembly factor BamB